MHERSPAFVPYLSSTRNLNLPRFFILPLTLALAACGGGGGSGSSDKTANSNASSNSAPTVSGLSFSPATPKTTDQIAVTATVADSDGDSLDTRYSWSVNDIPVSGADTDSLGPEYFKKGDNVTVTVTASDGTDQTSASLSVTIANSAPTIAELIFSPSTPKTADQITVTATVADNDGDALDTRYSWSVNESPVPGADTDRLGPEHFEKDDNVTVTVIASDGTDDATASLSVTIADTPPEVTVSGAPDSLAFGTTASFSVDVNDPDNDPFEYRFLARPNGMTIDNSGVVTWHPRSPLFRRETGFSWALAVDQAGASEAVSGTIRVVDQQRRPPISRTGVVTPTQDHPDMMIAGDFNLDGENEILASDGKQRLYTLVYNGTDYEQSWLYPFGLTQNGDWILSLHTASNSDNTQVDFIIGTGRYRDTSKGELIVIDAETREISRRVVMDGKAVDAIGSGDFDGDGKIEFAALVYGHNAFDEKHLAILDATTLETEWRSPSLKLGNSLAIGQFDNDPSPEIALSGGYLYGYADGEYRNLWAYGAGFGELLEAGDLDADGVDELVAVNDYRLRVFSPTEKSLIVADDVLYIDDFTIEDLDTGAGKEILALSDWDMSLKSISLSTDLGSELIVNWSEFATGRERANPLFADIDNDGEVEIAWSAGWGEKFYVVSFADPAMQEWETPLAIKENATFSGGEQVITGDGTKRLLFFTEATDQLSPLGPYRGVQLDPNTGAISWNGTLDEGRGIQIGTRVADIDQDGFSEFFYFLGETIGSYSLVTDSIIWPAPALPSNGAAMAHGFINDDTYLDFAVISESGQLYAFDAFNQTILGGFDTEVFPMGFSIQDVEDNEGLEYIVASRLDIRTLSQGDTGAEVLRSVVIADLADSPDVGDEAQYFPGMLILDMVVDDVDGDGSLEIAVATEAAIGYWILVFNEDLEMISHYEAPGEVSALAVEGYGSHNKNLVVATRSEDLRYHTHSTLYTLDPITGKEISRSPEVLGIIAKGGLSFIDVEDDGYTELSYSTSQGMHSTR
ncbi:hypothetical protein [Biformimicrobium ophioploci]|uniref:Uncharacterized protein n=1 Tax=Biformimicrobium ophioploci TaxID=3036711 RepID=A0ABQ6LX17_9GAMM|nr:hypothetical protein [Microbulbifer sp. NKW57]GMG86572.1 hypothetical protein MNKW57_08930 [Microbulbifer sp. NKW57]